eukprot:scaffold1807_cov140-Cylindrotheca_fusiformis.AAC.11
MGRHLNNNHLIPSPRTTVDDNDGGATVSTTDLGSKSSGHFCDAVTNESFIRETIPQFLSIEDNLHDAQKEEDRIRCRYLSRLGIYRNPTKKKTNNTRSIFNHQHKSAKFFVVPLKGDNGQIDRTLKRNSEPLRPTYIADHTSSSSRRNNQERIRAVRFQPEVGVHLIPSHTAYSKRLKQTIWVPVEEVGPLMRRNILEFWSENCDPNHVVEEDCFIPNGDNELIHPAHFIPEYEAVFQRMQQGNKEIR